MKPDSEIADPVKRSVRAVICSLAWHTCLALITQAHAFKAF